MLSTVLILLRSIGKLNKLHRTVCDEENKFLKSHLARVSTQSTFQTKLNVREWCRFDGEDVSQIPTSPVFRFWRQIFPVVWFSISVVSNPTFLRFWSKFQRKFISKEKDCFCEKDAKFKKIIFLYFRLSSVREVASSALLGHLAKLFLNPLPPSMQLVEFGLTG